MKKFLFIISITIAVTYLLTLTQVNAATPTPDITKKPTITSPSTTEKLNQEINNLKDRIASRVAELRLVEKRGVMGIVDEATSAQITVTDVKGNTVIADVDDITKFTGLGNDKTFGISDLTKGTKISILGLYNKQSKRITARFVDEVTIPVYVDGMASNVDTDNGTLTVANEDGKEVPVDVENVTKISSYTEADGLAKSGLSKIDVGNRVFVQGYPDKKDKSRVVATRILVLPNLAKDPKIVIPDKALLKGGTITPSVGNGKKLTPIK